MFYGYSLRLTTGKEKTYMKNVTIRNMEATGMVKFFSKPNFRVK